MSIFPPDARGRRPHRGGEGNVFATFLVPLSLVLLSAGLTAVALGQATPDRSRGARTISVDEITPGMRGYGLTVFRGREPERFDVEVIDVLENFQPDQDLILVRTLHPILERAATVAGMSGSPVYLDGRLAGAYAYGWPFGKDPVAGVTPIANMLAELDRPVRPDAFPGADRLARRGLPRSRSGAAAAAGASRGGPPNRLAGLPASRGWSGEAALPGATSALDAHLARRGRVGGGGTPGGQGERLGPVPAATPLVLGGFSGALARWLEDQLEPLGLLALQGGGGASGSSSRAGPASARATGGDDATRDLPGSEGGGQEPGTPGRGRTASAAGPPNPRFVDGGAIGVQLIRGDVSATAIGTITHVDGRRLVAFGHPMMNAGETGLPTSTARILHVLVSERRSFKIGEAEAPLGTLIHDRQAAIVVDRELEAPAVPVTLRVRGVPDAPRSTWGMEVVSHRVLTPLLTFAAIGNALKATVADQTDVTFTATTTVSLAGKDPITLVDRGFVPGGPSDLQALSKLRMFAVIEAAYGNPFEDSRVLGVDVELDLRFERDVERILDARLPAGKLDPGSTVPLQVITRRYGEPERVRVVPLRIPERAAGEEIRIDVRAGDETPLEHPEPSSLDDLLGIVERRLPATALTVSVAMPTRGLRFRGHVVRALPGSALDALQLANDGGQIRPFRTEDRQVVDLGQVLTGHARLEVDVRERALD